MGLNIRRRRRVAWGRRVLGAFFVAWLTVALQPCVMAAEIEHDCPHCPPPEKRELPPCDEILALYCAVDEQLTAEPRSQQIKVKDSPNDLPIAIAPASYSTATHTLYDRPVPHGAVFLSPSGPPRNVLFCVYLK